MGFNRDYESEEDLMVNEDGIANVFHKNGFTRANLAKCGRKRLESVVTRLVHITSPSCNDKKENYTKPKWWPKEVVFARLGDLKKNTPDELWNPFLRKLVVLCWEFYDNSEICEEKKQNKATVLCEAQQTDYRHVLCLRDTIVKPEIVCKDSFVKSLNLLPVDGNDGEQEEILAPNIAKPTRLAFTPNVPFSSDYAQALLKREKPASLEETHLKRLERNERYLNGDCNVTDFEYPVCYDKKEALYCHLYQFPVRQAWQIQDKLTVLKNLCKPVSVILKRCKPPSKKKKVLKVVLTRLKLNSLRLRNGNERKVYTDYF